MPASLETLDTEALHERAYEAFNQRLLQQASTLFEVLLQREPEAALYHYMRGLAHKYLCDWPTSLRHSLNVVAPEPEDENARWRAADDERTDR